METLSLKVSRSLSLLGLSHSKDRGSNTRYLRLRVINQEEFFYCRPRVLHIRLGPFRTRFPLFHQNFYDRI